MVHYVGSVLYTLQVLFQIQNKIKIRSSLIIELKRNSAIAHHLYLNRSKCFILKTTLYKQDIKFPDFSASYIKAFHQTGK